MGELVNSLPQYSTCLLHHVLVRLWVALFSKGPWNVSLMGKILKRQPPFRLNTMKGWEICQSRALHLLSCPPQLYQTSGSRAYRHPFWLTSYETNNPPKTVRLQKHGGMSKHPKLIPLWTWKRKCLLLLFTRLKVKLYLLFCFQSLICACSHLMCTCWMQAEKSLED